MFSCGSVEFDFPTFSGLIPDFSSANQIIVHCEINYANTLQADYIFIRKNTKSCISYDVCLSYGTIPALLAK